LRSPRCPRPLGPAWLWAWSSPACVQPPFLKNPPAQVVERQGNYARTDHWLANASRSRPSAPHGGGFALSSTRPATFFAAAFRARTPRHADELARLGAGGISVEVWTAWVKSLAHPEPAERAQP